MSIGKDRKVTIVGAGLGGALIAVYLARLGFRVYVYERRADPRRAGYVGGRSINLALSARGLWGLEGVGLDQAVLARALPMKGRMIHPPTADAHLSFQPYSRNPTDAINSISRGELNIALLDACETHDNIELFFSQRCLDVDLDKPSVTFQDDATGAIGTVESDLVIGADGAFSAVRAKMQKSDRFEYAQTYLEHGYKELHIPARESPGPFGRFALDPTALHIWPRSSAMMIALPNLDHTFTCTLFWPFQGDHGFDALRSPARIEEFFKQHYPDTLALMPTLVSDFEKNPTSSLVTVRCAPWFVLAPNRPKDAAAGTVLLGDAAHAIVPFFGQGMNAAFEDCRILARSIEDAGGDLAIALPAYHQLRKPNTDAIADMALENFVEMRDKVGSPAFRYRKRLEHFLHDLFPTTLIPRYNLVSFTTIPYAQAKRIGDRFSRVMRGLIVLVMLLLLLGLVLLKVPSWSLLVAVVLLGWIWWEFDKPRSSVATRP